MAERPDQAGLAEQAHGTFLHDVDHHRLPGLAAHDEADETVVAGVGVGHGAVAAVDGEHGSSSGQGVGPP